MSILVVDDDAMQRSAVSALLEKWGYEAVTAESGEEAWGLVEDGAAPTLIVLDRTMPGLDGIELCRRLRSLPNGELYYIIMLTGRSATEEIDEGLEAGADDYVLKPFHGDELRIRLRNARRLMHLRSALLARDAKVDANRTCSHHPDELIAICSYCKKIRDDDEYWAQPEAYLSRYTDFRFTHGICPGCYTDVVEPEIDMIEASEAATQELVSD